MEEDRDLERLEALACTADDMFEITPPDAPGACFAGALFSCGRGDARETFSAGAADITAEKARRRCLGEIAETRAQFSGHAELGGANAPAELSDPQTRELASLGPGDAGYGESIWLPGFRIGGGSASLPAALCLRAEAAPRNPQASSLGCAAGATRQQALASAMLELVERDAVALWWHGGIPAAPVSSDILDDGGVLDLHTQLRQGRTGRQIHFLDLTTDLGVPSSAAVSCDEDGGRLALGFGADVSMAAACRKAMFEMIQMELGNRIVEMKASRSGRDRLSLPDRTMLDRLAGLDIRMLPFRTEPVEKSHGRHTEAGSDQAAWLAGVLAGAGQEIFGVDLAKSPDRIPVVKLLAPRLQPLPLLWKTARLEECQKVHTARLTHFPTLGLL